MARLILTSTNDPKEGNLHYYHLPKGLLKLTLTKRLFEGREIFEVDVASTHIPDPDHRYYLQYHANPYTQDDLDIEYYQTGFLKKVSFKVEDKSLEIIDKLVSTGEEVTKAIVGTRGVEKEGDKIYEAVIDPFEQETMKRINKELDLLETGIAVSIVPMRKKDQTTKQYAPPENQNRGIYCRPLEPYEFVARAGGMEQRQIVYLPHPDILHFIHLPTNRFVANSFLIEFNENGYPIHINLVKPSQALQIMDIPLKILRAIVRIPGELLKLRIDYQSSKEELIETEMKLTKSLLELEEKQRVLDEKINEVEKKVRN